MVLQFLPLRLPKRAPQGVDPVIDLTDGNLPEDDLTVVDVTDRPVVDGPAGDQEDAPQSSGQDRAARATALLRLSRTIIGEFSPATSVVIATGWLLGLVIVGCLAVTAAAGMISGQALLDPAGFVAFWRIAHLMPVAAADGPVSLLPMLPALIVLGLVVRASSWLWAALQPGGRSIALGGTAAMGAGYVVVAALVATSPTSGGQSGPMTQGWAALVGLVLLGLAWTWGRRVVRPQRPRTWLLLRATGTVLGMLIAAAALLLLAMLVLSWPEMQDMSRELLASGAEPATWFDAVALGAIQLAYLPNLVVWTASYLIGAGFAVGTDTIVSPFTVSVGTLPEIPLVTLLPGQPMGWPWLPPLLIALGSIAAGAIIRSAGLAWRMRTRMVAGLAVAALAAFAVALLAAASGGGLGPGRLEAVGPDPFVTGVWTLLVIGLGQVAWALFPTLVADLVPFVTQARHAAVGLRRRPRRPRIGRRGGRDAKVDRHQPDQTRQT